MKDWWNARYAEPEYAYGEAPNAFFAGRLGPPPRPGASRILLPADGEGRNGVHAARLGWRVDAFDLSEEGQAKALALAARHGVEIRYTLASFETVELEEGAYDALALIFAHMHESVRQGVHQRLARALAPGGRLLLEAYAVEQLRYETGGPPSPAMLYSLEDARRDFAELEILSLEQVEAEVVEGKYHTGLASVIRLEARRPR